MAYHNFHGLETRIVRIFNTYGPRMRLNDGRALPAFIGQALRGEDLTVFGDGSQTRSFCYVDDLVEGIYRLLMSDYAEPVNIGNPDEISLKDFAEEIIKLTGNVQKIIYQPLPTDDPKQLLAARIQSFPRIGHCLFALLFGWLGKQIALRLHAKRTFPANNLTSSILLP